MAERPADDRPAQPPSGGEQPALSPLVAQVIDRWESDGALALDEVCAAHPQQAAALRDRVDRLRRAGLLGDPPPDAALPARLGSFRILALLGRGGMGVVYLAEQEDLGRRVALKLVRPEHLLFPGARERFRREVAAVARLQHAGIVPVHAAGEAGGIPFYAMELVRGAALEEVLQKLAGRHPARLTGADLRAAVEEIVRERDAALAGGTPAGPRAPGGARSSSASGEGVERLFGGTWPTACLRVAHLVALALQHAHEQGILHRDVKPSNVMVTPEGRVLLLDFGLAASAGNARLTSTGSQLGSLAWMAPEQVRGARDELDARTDVYALGATLYELLALRTPYAAGGVEETRARILEGRPVPLRELNPAVPRDAETVCLKAMDADRARRYASAAEFAHDLRAALELRPVEARRPGALLKARRWAQRNPARAAAVALAAVLLVGGPVGYGLLQARAAGRERLLNEDLRLANTRLDAALGDVRTANDGLTTALASEKAQRERAQRAFDRSRDAVDELLSTVGAEDLQNLPQFEPVRTRLLERALDFYRGLQAESPGDVGVAREQARTHRAMGDLLRELGRNDEARSLYEQAIAELEQALAQTPDDEQAQRVLATAIGQIGALDYTQGKYDDAQRHWEDARARLEPLATGPKASLENVGDVARLLLNLSLVAHARGDEEGALALSRRAAVMAAPAAAAHPDDLSIAGTHAEALASAATLASDLGRQEEAEPLFAQAWDALRNLLRREPSDRTVREKTVECAGNYGLMLLTRADRARAEAVLREGFAIAAALARDFPQEPQYAQDCAVIGTNVVAELINQSRFAEAEPLAAEAVARLARVVADHPDLTTDVYYLGFAEAALSAVHQGLGRLDDAAREAQQGIDHLRQARAALGENPALLSQLACAICQRGEVERAQGDPTRSLATLEEALALGSQRADVVFQLCEALARCSMAARDDAALAPDQRDALRRHAEDLCLQTLRDAIRGGFSDLERVRTSPDFALVRARPEFEEALSGTAAP